MIHHYVNLVMWQKLYQSRNTSNEVFFCDSITFYYAARILGFQFKRCPGTQIVSELLKLSRTKRMLLLVSEECSFNANVAVHVLPQFDTHVYLEEELRKKIQLQEPEYILIGISSPKQNLFARLIQKEFNDVKIYCLGAALRESIIGSQSSKVTSRLGLEWLRFFFISPARSIVKLVLTLVSIVQLVFNKKYRKDFREFCSHNTFLSKNR